MSMYFDVQITRKKMCENKFHKDEVWKMAHMQLLFHIMLNITQS